MICRPTIRNARRARDQVATAGLSEEVMPIRTIPASSAITTTA
jgi:hypothetical protein